MPKMKAVKGVLKTFWSMAKEDFAATDHKLVRIAVGVVSFVVMALLWFYVFRTISPFRF